MANSSRQSWRHRLARIAQQVSTKPTSSSYVWGGRLSPLPYLTFHAVYFLRLLSPLQWVKYVVRRRAATRTTTNLRPDFPSAFTEWYFITLFALAGIAYVVKAHLPALTGPVHAIAICAGWLLITEAAVWILYYLLLRGFLETRYTIFHPAEYLLTFPLVIAVQALLLALVTRRSLISILNDATGRGGNDLFDVIVTMVTLFYFGVAITIVLTSHPGIKTRSSQNLVIIGAGDVTLNRILPALQSLGYRHDDIVAVTIDEPKATDRARVVQHLARLEVVGPTYVLDTSLRERSTTIIASPTYAHFAQLVQLANAGVPFAVEKPITASSAEREVLRNMPSLMDNGFAFSYYTLEKALPLTFFMQPLPIYSRFLESEPSSLLDGSTLDEVREELGKAISLRIEIFEGISRSPSGSDRLWTELPGTLRPFIETTIHPLLVMRRLIGPGEICWKKCLLGRYTPRAEEIRAATGKEIAPTLIQVEGTLGQTRIELNVAKYVPEDSTGRRVIVDYTNGRLVCDFDQRRATITVGGVQRGWIAIDNHKDKGRYAKDYTVLMSMFIEFSVNGWGATRFDDFYCQLDALEWWDTLCDTVAASSIPVHPYSKQRPSAPMSKLSDVRSRARSSGRLRA